MKLLERRRIHKETVDKQLSHLKDLIECGNTSGIPSDLLNRIDVLEGKVNSLENIKCRRNNVICEMYKTIRDLMENMQILENTVMDLQRPENIDDEEWNALRKWFYDVNKNIF